MNKVLSCPFSLDDDSTRILWEITSKCNLKCKHCLYYSSDNHLKKDMSKDEIFKVIEDISTDKTVKAIWLSGGEPLLNPDLLEIISKISSCGIKPSLSTNGTLVSSKEYAMELHRRGVDYVHLSIDGVTAEVHDEFRNVQGSFEKVMNAVDFLNHAGIVIGVTFMVTEQSIDSVEKMIALAIKKNIQVLSFYLVEPIGRGKSVEDANRPQLMLRINSIIKKARLTENKNLRIELFRTVESSGQEALKQCKGYNFLTITNSGELGACPWLIKSNDSIKKVLLTTTPFKQAKKIVQESMKNFLKERSEILRKHCSECKNANCCGKGCPAVSGFDLLDPLCQYIK